MSTSAPLEGGGNLEAQFIYDGSKAYVVIPSFKSYAEIESLESLSDNMPTITPSEDANGELVKAYETTVDGTTYVCEEYILEGVTSKYYTTTGNRGNLSRIEVIDTDGSTSVMIIESVVAVADDSLFELPKGYLKLDLSGTASINSPADIGKVVNAAVAAA